MKLKTPGKTDQKEGCRKNTKSQPRVRKRN